jgi:Na+-translocating ferredoxin:NAD+ oxidoreductase RnfC subunit
MTLVDAVKQAGIIGCGGAGFPTHVKVSAEVGVVIANGAECEPLLNSDQRVMERFADELIDGLLLVMKNTGARKGYIALKKDYSSSIAALETSLKGRSDIEVFPLNNFYPAGDEQILLTEVTGKIVPEGGIPLNVGAVVSNVLTFVQIARAERGEVVTSRIVTLAGEVKKPQVVDAPIGMAISELMNLAMPAIPVDDIVVIDGGPMMGRIVDLDSVVNKTTSGLLFLAKDHPLIVERTIPMSSMIRRSVAACCQCRMCTDVCSRYMQGHAIEPHFMMRSLAYRSAPTKGTTAAFLCSQCGLCEFACPMNLSPKRAFAELLKKYQAGGMKNPHDKMPEAVHEFNEYRKISKDRIIRRYSLLSYNSHSLPLVAIDDPSLVRLSLSQAIGAPSEPVVKAGDSVNKGDLVAKIPEGKLSSNLHASIGGRIKEIENGYIVIEGGK